jgi:hypothetical protein
MLCGQDGRPCTKSVLELYHVGTVNRQKIEKRYSELNAKIDQHKAREAELHEQHKAAVEQMVPVRDIKEACDLVWTWMGQDPPFEVKQKVVSALLTRVVAWLEEGDEHHSSWHAAASRVPLSRKHAPG